MKIQDDVVIMKAMEDLKNYWQCQKKRTPFLHILTFGCQQNEADSEKLYGYAESFGYEKTEEPSKADLILLNTCAIREHAESKALSLTGRLKMYKQSNEDLLIGICGCMAAEEHRVTEIKEHYPYVDFTLDPGSIAMLPKVVLEKIQKQKRVFQKSDETPVIVEGLPIKRSESHRAYVSIMYGCNNFCSYCIVPYVRGRERSRSSAEIIAEVRSCIENGCKDITLLGQNVNSYAGDMTFPELLFEIDKIPGDYVLRFMTSHPKDASDELIEVLKNGTHISKSFHLPVQSGNDKVLKEMNRHYNLERYMSIVHKLREAIPDIVLTTDMIVGFPGETEEEFQDTLSLMKEVKFDSIFSFIYSPRTGTPAAKRTDQVEKNIQSERCQRLLHLQDEIALERAKRFENRDMRVLVDGISKENPEFCSGRTDGGKLVHVKADKKDIGQFIMVHIDRAAPFILYGTKI